ncbi:MAG: M20 family peptidase [Lacunisphaera sp.]|nr:M20 family peptidase [Lacunisphaera sp.]
MDPEQTMLAFIADREGSLLQFARDLVATPSPTPPGDERAVVGRIQQELDTLGLGKAQIIALKPERPNLLLRLKGSRPGLTLIFNGHLDTKPHGNLEEWEFAPLNPVIRDGRLHGLGSSDMKSGLAAMVYAAAAVMEVRDSMPGELQLMFTADEEGGSKFGAEFLSVNGHVRGDAALISESAGVHKELEFIALDSRGSFPFRVRVYGDQMHCSLSDEFKAVNASVKAAELLWRFAQEYKRPGVTVNAGVVLQGGVFFGVVPGLAEFGCDVRVPPGWTQQKFRAEIEAWLDGHRRRDAELRAEIVWESWGVLPTQFPRDHPLATSLQKACAKVLPRVPPVTCYPAGTDAPWFIAAGVPTIPAFGPGLLPLAHSPREWVEIPSIFACARIYALTAHRYLSGEQSQHS